MGSYAGDVLSRDTVAMTPLCRAGGRREENQLVAVAQVGVRYHDKVTTRHRIFGSENRNPRALNQDKSEAIARRKLQTVKNPPRELRTPHISNRTDNTHRIINESDS